MLVANPLLTLLGRRGRPEVVEVLRRHPGRTWRVRELARTAGVAPMVASRAVRELSALGAVDVLRPGRDSRVRWRAQARAGGFLHALQVPDLREAAATAFASAYRAPPGVVRLLQWQQPGDDPADPLCPTRVAVLAQRNEDAAAEAVGPALDAALLAGLPPPTATTHLVAGLEPDDPVAQAIVRGRRLPFSGTATATEGS